jgi:alpha-galactosidase
LAAPLMAGNDLRKMSPTTKDILTNKEVVAIDQDERGVQAYKYAATDSLETWIKPLKNNEIAICFLNRSAKPKSINMSWTDHPVIDDLSKTNVNFSTTTYKIHDVWTKKDMGTTNATLNEIVPSHDVVMIRLSK